MNDDNKNEAIRFTNNEQINRLLNNLVRDVRGFTEHQLGLIRKLTQIGAALSAEKNIDRLLEMIVDEARNFTHADGGTLYVMSDDETAINFAIVQNNALKIRMGGTGGKITWPPVPLKNPDGSPNYANVSAYAALSAKVVNIPDVYDAEGFNFQGTRKFDADTGYRSKSMLVVPLQNHENDIIGVLQLLNAQDSATGEVINFSYEYQQMTESLASQAAVALSNNRLIHDLENLLESFITTIATAIDEKSPYTGGHVRRVADLTLTIADRINKMADGVYANVYFNDDLLKELRIAAWLHDVGKITTPEYVVDKATKLESIYDRIETLKTRFEVLRRDHEIDVLKNRLMDASARPAASLEAAGGSKGKTEINEEIDTFVKGLEEDIGFLVNANTGGEFMADEMLARIKDIAARTWLHDGAPQPLLTENEVYNLTIRRGTLTNEEREIINNHARVTYKMLSRLPFPKKLRRVPDYAAAHHEKMDGTGYPHGLKGDELSLQSRILALADVFEALTAKDRPYKRGKTLSLSEALKIMTFMVKDGHIDKDLFELFIKEKIYLDYAQKELALQQIDQFDPP
ncbi:MAG: HD domain-containing phosphohydrolase [Syntrophales bacterium]|nr:HD domain-containing phosphohydrolase [Syntrophales bacterium]